MVAIFQGAMYCDDCAKEMQNALTECDDSDAYPISYPDAGEADYPVHCDGCGVFLGNALTEEGRKYVIEMAISEIEDNERGPGMEYVDYYCIDLPAGYGECINCGKFTDDLFDDLCPDCIV